MRRLFVLILVISVILAGCGEDEISFKEVSLDKANKNVKEFTEYIATNENSEGSGIYMFNDSESVSYLYLTEDFLGAGKHFGDLDLKLDDNSLNIYLTEDSDVSDSVDGYKLYKIKVKTKKEYDYMKIYKNGEETYFQLVGA